jgi:predicted amidohydrolase
MDTITNVQNARIAVAQLTSTSDIAENLALAKTCCKLAKSNDVGLLCFPECFAYLGLDTLQIGEPLENSSILSTYSLLALEFGLWFSLGGFPERCERLNKIYNTHIIMDDKGKIVATYRKVHLFTVDIDGGPKLDETLKTEPGDELVIVNTPFGKLGLAICYDLRFPELFSTLRKHGAQIILVPSAFTVETGKAHWHILLQARAIENQCYVIAAAQVGKHSDLRSSYGHSLIVDPWGKVLLDLNELTTEIGFVDIDTALIQKVRTQLPKEKHQKPDIYSKAPHFYNLAEPTLL